VVEYSKPWLSVDEQVDQLHRRGVHVPDRAAAAALLREVGYYRLTGYLYPFRESIWTERAGRTSVTVLDTYRAGTTFTEAAVLLAFDRQLRLLVIEGVERIEVAIRTHLAHVLGRSSPFAHEDATTFTDAFTARQSDGTGAPSAHEEWLDRVRRRQLDSDEAFVAHFRTKYDGRMPIWALIEILEFGQVSRLYGGLRNDVATETAAAFGVPTKKLMQSWLATINYVRNVAAHHARLFNRKLVVAPRRPTAEQVPLLAHLSAETAPKRFGVYSALAVMAYLLASVSDDDDWPERTAALLGRFPESAALDLGSMGALPHWLSGDLWVRGSRRAPRRPVGGTRSAAG
jgi:abortive infection bacteriophage resistance protein